MNLLPVSPVLSHSCHTFCVLTVVWDDVFNHGPTSTPLFGMNCLLTSSATPATTLLHTPAALLPLATALLHATPLPYTLLGREGGGGRLLCL